MKDINLNIDISGKINRKYRGSVIWGYAYSVGQLRAGDIINELIEWMYEG